jgi:signal transduction histidine kinase
MAAVLPAALLAAAGVVGLAVSPTAGGLTYFVAVLVPGVVALVLAFQVNRRCPSSPIAPLIAASGVAVLLLTGDVYDAAAARRPGVLPETGAAFDALTDGIWMLLYLPLAMLLLLFPDGRLPGRRWRLVGYGVPLVVVVFNLAIAVSELSETAHAVAVVVASAMPPLLLAGLIGSALSVAVRYRRADPVTRMRLRWIGLAGAAFPLTLLLAWFSYFVGGGPTLFVAGLLIVYLAVPAAAAIALLRGDRVDVDSVLVSTATYVVLAALLLTVLSAASAAAGLVVSRMSTTAAIVVTVLCTLAVPSLHRRVSKLFGRWLYPARHRALAALAELRAAVHRGQATPEAIEPVLRQALRDPGLRVGYRPLDGGPVVGLDGAVVTSADRSVPIRLGGEEIGLLFGGPGQPKPPPREVGAAAGFLVDVVRLRSALQRALLEVGASRARILRAGDEERHRLERDLHDGAQQRLVSLGMALRVLQRTHPDADGITDALDAAVAEIGTAVAELRQIAHGLRPSSLDDGLAPALAGLIRLSPTPVNLQITAEALPDDVSTTVYYVASEALTNAIRYADADRIDVSVAQEDGQVSVRIQDDGRGGAEIRPGAGLAGLRDRVTALGGRLQVADGQARGTVVEAVLPCGS